MSEDISEKIAHGLGWVPDLPDCRDFTLEHDTIPLKLRILGQTDSIKAMAQKLASSKTTKASLATSVDLRQYFSPIEDQGSLGSCTAQAGVGLVEYFERRSFGKHIDASKLFLYKVTRNLLGWTGDRGAYLRTTMGALTLFGVPPEQYWKYNIANFDVEPSSFLYAFAGNYQAISYFRYDIPGTSPADLLKKVKTYLGYGIPAMFGFSVYSSIRQANTTGKIPFPSPGDSLLGGHAVVAVGYDDAIKIKNASRMGIETTGALLIRNSWGPSWGDHGYGWLPYEYVLKELALDWWSLLKNEWVNTGNFGTP